MQPYAAEIPTKVHSKHSWSLRSIRWGLILKYQHWGGVLLLIPAAVVTGIAHWRFQDWPVERQALIYDASISYPHTGRDTIPNYLATLLNWICFVFSVLVVELIIFRRQHSLTVAICGTIHHIWCCIVSFVIVVAITEITKPFSGRLRPDFLARCQPRNLIDPNSDFVSVVSNHAATLGPLHLGQLAEACTNPNAEDIRQGRLSFPSGHSSNSMSVAWYTSLYLMWSLYLRVDNPYPKKLYVATTLRGRLGQEVLYAIAYGIILLALCLSWFIGMTRFWDNVHNVSDIIGGFLCAIIFVTPFVIKAIGLHIAFRNQIDTGEAAAKVMRQETSIMAAPPAGPHPYMDPHVAQDPELEPGITPGMGVAPNGAGSVVHAANTAPVRHGRDGDAVLQINHPRT